VAGLKTVFPDNYEDVTFKPSDHPDYYELRKQAGPYKVNQAKLDRVFHDRDQFVRYNKGPEYSLEVSKSNQDFPGLGAFIIDKNINHDSSEPHSLLLPNQVDVIYNNMHFIKGEVKNPLALAQS